MILPLLAIFPVFPLIFFLLCIGTTRNRSERQGPYLALPSSSISRVVTYAAATLTTNFFQFGIVPGSLGSSGNL
ncbi:hypothetical protein F5B19DRAFT_454795 [Rostrohypoxylon terebratum]|nr:hypothetical protein F5B19DRAFT_454795 [Rostrohypoxylon terebratum]